MESTYLSIAELTPDASSIQQNLTPKKETEY